MRDIGVIGGDATLGEFNGPTKKPVSTERSSPVYGSEKRDSVKSVEAPGGKQKQGLLFTIQGKPNILARSYLDKIYKNLLETGDSMFVEDFFKIPDWADKNCQDCWGRGESGKLVNEDNKVIICGCVIRYMNKNIKEIIGEGKDVGNTKKD